MPSTTLRYYEDVGLIRPGRAANGYRVYDEQAVDRLRFITAAKRLRLPLPVIGELLEVWQSQPCRSVKQRLQPLLAGRIDDLEQDRAGLEVLVGQLRTALRRLEALPDRDTSCDPGCTFLDAAAPPEPAIACSLTSHELPNRRRQWREVLAGASLTEVPHGVLVQQIPASRAAGLAELIVAEQRCCPFFSFELSFTGETVQLAIAAPNGALHLVDELVATELRSVTV